MTEPYKIIEVKESVFADNDREAARLRTQLKQEQNVSAEPDVLAGQWQDDDAAAHA